MNKAFMALIRLYQKYISPLSPPSCRFYPSCSAYSLECYQRFNFFKASYLTIIRLSKCHPFHKGGIDLVPEKKEK